MSSATKRTWRRVLLCAVAVLASACTSAVKVQEPTTAKPVLYARAPVQNGAIFQDSVSFRPLFEDRRARYVGDTITVVINESTTASKEADMSAQRDANVNAGVSTVQGLPGKSLQGSQLTAAASSKQATKDGASANNAFTGTITTTVTQVLPNGYLMISGEKQIGINGEVEKLKFSGVVNPLYVVNGNQVSSSNVADARIDVGTHSHVEGEQVLGSMARFFFSFLPFR